MFVPCIPDQVFINIAEQNRKDKELRNKILNPGKLKDCLNDIRTNTRTNNMSNRCR